jgi:transglutaminase-like putative cysteine protease
LERLRREAWSASRWWPATWNTMPHLQVRHTTIYRYRNPVAFGEHRIMFRPRDSYDQHLLSAQIEITPQPRDLHWIHDVSGNCVAIALFDRKRSKTLRFESTIRVIHEPANTPDFRMEEYARTYPFTYGAEEMPDLTRLIERAYLDPEHVVDKWVRQFLKWGRPTETGQLLMTLTYAIKERFQYEQRVEMGTQDPVTTLEKQAGSCRDFAVLMMEAARALGLAARFVSGYLYVPADDTHVGGGNTHAWCEVYLPGAGWVEFDPTNGIIGSRDLIRVAVARDPRQAVPLHGTWYGAQDDNLGMSVEVEVQEIDEGNAKSEQALTRQIGPGLAPPAA